MHENIQANTFAINNGNAVIKNLFGEILKIGNIFENRDKLTSSYIPDLLPHRDEEIKALALILRPALSDETPSNIVLTGKSGTGKTAVTKYVKNIFSERSKIIFIYLNAHTIDTNYRVLQNIAENLNEKLPFTGLPTDEIYKKTLSLIDKNKCNLILIIDEADKLKNDDVLYTLSRVNENLKYSKVSLILIANDLHFRDFYDLRVKSSLSAETVVFKPYNANQLFDILKSRAALALKPNVLDEDVIPLCSALAAQEHGDARRALDLLRMSAELAERKGAHRISKKHVLLAQNKIEGDKLKEVINGLPSQIKLILYTILRINMVNERKRITKRITTGEIYNVYDTICKKTRINTLTHRRVGDLISELELLGIITAQVISKGRYGRTRVIKMSSSTEDIMKILQEDDLINSLSNFKIKDQARLF